jgi:hypothetical protein
VDARKVGFAVYLDRKGRFYSEKVSVAVGCACGNAGIPEYAL